MRISQKLISLTLAIFIVSSFITQSSAWFYDDPVHFTVGAAEGSAGDTVTVAVSVLNNTSGFSGLEISLTYDSRWLAIVSSAKLNTGDGNFDGGMVLFNNNYSGDTVKAVYAGMEDNTYNGDILSFTFKIKEAPPEAVDSILSLEIGYLSDVDGALLPSAVTNGTVTVTPHPDIVIGDIDGDGAVTMADAMILFDYLSGVRTLTDEQKLAADVDGDGAVTMADAMRMFDYLAGIRPEL